MPPFNVRPCQGHGSCAAQALLQRRWKNTCPGLGPWQRGSSRYGYRLFLVQSDRHTTCLSAIVSFSSALRYRLRCYCMAPPSILWFISGKDPNPMRTISSVHLAIRLNTFWRVLSYTLFWFHQLSGAFCRLYFLRFSNVEKDCSTSLVYSTLPSSPPTPLNQKQPLSRLFRWCPICTK